MDLTLEKQAINGTLLYTFFNNGYPKSYMTGALKVICVSNKQVFLKAVLRVKRIKAGRYIASERSYLFCSSWLVLYIYLRHRY